MSRRPPYKLRCRCGARVELDTRVKPGLVYCREAQVLRAARRLGWLWRGGSVSKSGADCVCPTCSVELSPLHLDADPIPGLGRSLTEAG